jgi:hypothetical protein
MTDRYQSAGNGFVLDTLKNLTFGPPSPSRGTMADALGAVGLANMQAYCGRRDWRLPSTLEAVGLVTYKDDPAGFIQSPLIDPAFVGTPANYFWTSDQFAFQAGQFYTVEFTNGTIGINDGSGNPCFYRLVAGASQRPQLTLTDGGQTVTDTANNRTWMRSHLKPTWDEVTDADANNPLQEWRVRRNWRNWQDCMDAACATQFLGRGGWRLPTPEELASICDLTRGLPALNALFLPTPLQAFLWSSVRARPRFAPGGAYVLQLDDGRFAIMPINTQGYVILVRDGLGDPMTGPSPTPSPTLTPTSAPIHVDPPAPTLPPGVTINTDPPVSPPPSVSGDFVTHAQLDAALAQMRLRFISAFSAI